MSNYVRANTGGATHFGDKDALSTGDGDKIIVGAQFDSEFEALVIAVNSKYDSDDIATTAEAEDLALDTVLITPSGLNDVLVENAGILGDLQALTVAGFSAADAILGWDTSAGAAIGFTLGAGLSHAATEINVADAIAGAGLQINSSVLSFDINGLTSDTPVLGDYIAFEDVGGGVDNKCTITALMTLLENNITLQEADISDLQAYYLSGSVPTFGTITTTGNITGDGATVISGIETVTIDATGDVTKTSHGNYLYHASTSYNADQNGQVTFGTGVASSGTTGDIHFQYTA